MRIVCIIVVASSFSLIGFLLAGNERAYYDRTRDMLNFITYMRKMMSDTVTLPRIISSYRGNVSDTVFYTTISASSSDEPLSSRWLRSVNLLSLPNEAEEALVAFGSDLGAVDLRTQLKRADDCIAVLEAFCKEQSSVLDDKGKVYKSVFTLIGLMAAIILI